LRAFEPAGEIPKQSEGSPEAVLRAFEPAGEIPKQSEGSPEAVLRASESAGEIPNSFSPQFTTTLAIIRGMQQTMVDDV